MSKIIENSDCDIVSDLLPLYCDDVASEATREAVEEHLAKCESCRKEYERLTAGLSDEFKEESTKRIFDNMMHRERVNRIIKSVASVVFICVLIIGGFFVQRNIPVVEVSPENIQWCHVYRIDTEYGKRFYIYHHNYHYYSSTISTSVKLSDDGKTLNLSLKKALIAPAYETDNYLFGLIVNKNDNYMDGYSYFSEKDTDYSNVTTVRLNGKVVWTEKENGNDKIPDFVYLSYKSEYSGMRAGEDGIEMEFDGKATKNWDWNGNIISKKSIMTESIKEKTTQVTTVTEEF